MTTTAERIKILEASLKEGADVAEISQDGTRVRFDRKQAIDELNRLRRLESRQHGRRPRVSSINLSKAF